MNSESLSIRVTYIMQRFAKFFLAGFVVLFSSCGQKVVEEKLIPISEKALNDTASVFYADFASYPRQKSQLPIGVFDSGTGGLTVQEVLLTLDSFDNITGKEVGDGIPDFAGENFVYLADDANMPYGDYDAAGKSDYLRELVVKDALFLMGDKYYNLAIDDAPYGEKMEVKVIVIACNTATAYGLADIEKLLAKSGTGVKVIGVINAGVRAALADWEKDTDYAIGVMATPGTISSGAYQRTINEIAAQKGLNGKITVVNQSALGFANAVDGVSDYVKSGIYSPREEYRGPIMGSSDDQINPSIIERYFFDYSNGALLYSKSNGEFDQIQLNSADNYARFHLVSLVEKYRKSGCDVPLKSIILGCTHYPFHLEVLNKTIEQLRNYKKDGVYIYKNCIAEDFTFIDPAQYTAKECYKLLRENHELALRTSPGKLYPYISIPSYGLDAKNLDEDGNLTYDFKYGRAVGTEDITTKVVPFSSRYIDQETQDRIKRLVPESYSLIKERL